MVYIGLRREITVAGWMLAPHALDVKHTCDPQGLQEVMQRSLKDTEDAITNFRQGRIVPQPADEAKCDYCQVKNACRYEVAAMQRLTTISVGAASE